jgi:hypothetical protein
MVRFLRDIMGLRVEFEQPTTTELSLSSGDRVQVFAPGDPYFAFFSEQASVWVPETRIDDGGGSTYSPTRRSRRWR